MTRLTYALADSDALALCFIQTSSTNTFRKVQIFEVSYLHSNSRPMTDIVVLEKVCFSPGIRGVLDPL